MGLKNNYFKYQVGALWDFFSITIELFSNTPRDYLDASLNKVVF